VGKAGSSRRRTPGRSVIWWLVAAAGIVAAGVPEMHNLHVSHGRMAVENDVVALRVRFFQHDLEDALTAHFDHPDVNLSENAASDSLFLSYMDQTFVLVSARDTLAANIVKSGEERDVWWYELQFKGPAPVETLQITNTTLFDMFADQQNIFQLTHFPSGRKETLYFVFGSDTHRLQF
jgi:hypothetical protein